MTLHRAARHDRRTLALYCGEQLYGYLLVSPQLRFVGVGRLDLLDAEPTYEELRVNRGLSRLPVCLPLTDALRELRGLVESTWASADALDEFAEKSFVFEAEANKHFNGEFSHVPGHC